MDALKKEITEKLEEIQKSFKKTQELSKEDIEILLLEKLLKEENSESFE